jgi:hypothetical protein
VFILQLRNCINEGMLWILRVFDLFSCWWTYFVVCWFCKTIRTCVCFFSVYEFFGCLCLCVGHWSGFKSTNGPWGAWVGHASAGPLGVWCGHESARHHKGMFYSSSTGTLIFARSIETCVESGFTTVIRTICNSGSFLLFWWGRVTPQNSKFWNVTKIH